MHYNADPDFVMHYCIQETALSPTGAPHDLFQPNTGKE